MKNQRVTGTTKITGLLGNPVKHSISPIIHNHAFSSLNLDYTYIPLGCEKEKLGGLIDSLKALDFAGANVTIPYKSEVIQYCDEISELSKITGTVNTLVYKDGKLFGTTTDGDGFLKAITSDGIEIENSSVVILGNGGTARTLAMVLAYKKLPAHITIVGRNSTKVEVLAQEIIEKTGFDIRYSTFTSENTREIFQQADIVINCTPVGMTPNEGVSPLARELFQKNSYYFDAIYNPTQTKFLQNAEEVGAKFQNGLKMLLFQGLESFKYWTEKEVPETIFDLDELYNEIKGE